jgi:ribonucleotide monophosphatase NagD (HAD superfamily)
MPRPRFALALDIDGVFLRGKQVIQNAEAALQLIQAARIPHVFMTNGGGMTENEKAEDLSKKLHAPVHPAQVILAHTPFKEFASGKLTSFPINVTNTTNASAT